MQEVIKVNDKELPVIEWKGQRVTTTAQLADIYETDVENVKRNFGCGKCFNLVMPMESVQKEEKRKMLLTALQH